MTESFRHEDTSSGRTRLAAGQVEVFFDGSTLSKPSSLVLHTALPSKVRKNTPFGLYEYEELVLGDGRRLSPGDLSPEPRIAEFEENFRPMSGLGAGALLRTIEYHQEMKFISIVKNVTTISERKVIKDDILQHEKKRMPRALMQQRELFDDYENIRLWIRLEAVFDPDKALVGKVIMAQLAYFLNHAAQVGITPIVYSANRGVTSYTPEQLVVDENWLYTEK